MGLIMKKKTLSYLSSGSLIAGAAIGLYAFFNIYILNRNLPAGICPVTANRPLLYVATALCCISFILSFFEPKSDEKPVND